ncbi:hypothetical protein AAFF_G00207080 [Aldrovandia affinis]|uniref:Uncharacterized protein n=1 Tax=Aldrovandia affinis TaxID=143900 RepID=A0AAD7RHY8_9TELE|nr:hypothetical protein AAFF_G00207080 [Aldrovandia affinis]
MLMTADGVSAAPSCPMPPSPLDRRVPVCVGNGGAGDGSVDGGEVSESKPLLPGALVQSDSYREALREHYAVSQAPSTNMDRSAPHITHQRGVAPVTRPRRCTVPNRADD